MIKLLNTSDLHISNYEAHSTTDKFGRSSRLLDFMQLAKDISIVVNKECVDVIIVAGDVFHTPVNRPQVNNLVRDFFQYLLDTTKSLIVVTIGQHDMDTKNELTADVNSVTTGIMPSDSRLVYVPKKAYVQYITNNESISIAVSSWTPDFKLPTYDSDMVCLKVIKGNDNAFNSVRMDSEYDVVQTFELNKVVNADVFVGHGAVVGCSNADVIRPHMFNHGFKQSDLESHYSLSVLGDIHHGQLFKDSSNVVRVCIPGNPIMTTYKDDPNCGVWVQEYDTSTAKVVNTQFYAAESISNYAYHKFITISGEDTLRPDSLNTHYRVITTKDSSSKKKKSDDIVSISSDLSVMSILSQLVSESKRSDLPKLTEILKELSSDLSNTSVKNIPNFTVDTLQLSNFMSIDNLSLDFKQINGDVVVFGHNGSGKTSIVEGLFWTITGNTTKRVKVDEVLNKYTDGDCLGVVVLSSDNESIKISRKRLRSGGTDFEVFIKTHDSTEWSRIKQNTTRDTEKFLEDKLGVSSSEILTLSYFSAEKLKLFCDLGDSEKSTLVTKIGGVEEVDAVRQSVTKKISSLKDTITEKTGSFTQLINMIESHKSNIIVLNSSISNDNNLAQINELTNNISKVSSTLESIDERELSERVLEVNSKHSIRSKELSNAELRKRQLELELNLLNTRKKESVDKLQSLQNSECPTCHSKVTSPDLLKSELVIAKDLLNRYNDISSSISDQVEIITKLKVEVASLLNEMNELESKLSKYREATSLLNNMRYSLDSLKSQSNSSLLTKRDLLQEQLSQYEKDKHLLSIELESDRSLLDTYDYLSTLLKKNGLVVSYLNKVLVKLIQEEVDQLLTDYPGIKISVSDKLEVRAEFLNRQPMNYYQLSGGQSRVVDVVMMIAFNNLFSRIYKLNGILGISILDEVLSFLDPEYMSVCVGLIDKSNANRKIIITHDEGVIGYYDNRILVSLKEHTSSKYVTYFK